MKPQDEVFRWSIIAFGFASIIIMLFCLSGCSSGGSSSQTSQSVPQTQPTDPSQPAQSDPPVASIPASTSTPVPNAQPTATPSPTPGPSPTPALFSCQYQAGYIAVCTGGNLGAALVQWQGCAGYVTDDSDYDDVFTVVNSIDPASGQGKSCITYGGDYPNTCCGMQMNVNTGLMEM